MARDDQDLAKRIAELIERALAKPLGFGVTSKTISVNGIECEIISDLRTDEQRAADELSEAGERTFYVYAHRDPSGRIFYIGMGQNRRAWSTDRHGLWHKYVNDRSGGNFTVEILKDHLTASEAERLEGRLISELGDTLVNWDNPSRGYDLAAISEYHARRDANALLVAQAKDLERSSPKEAIRIYTQALEEQRSYESLVLQRGSLVADLVGETPKFCSPDILDRLTLLLVRADLADEARLVAEAFFAQFPAASTSAKGKAIAKRIAKRT